MGPMVRGVHFLYKEEMATYFDYAFGLSFSYGLLRLAYLGLFSRVAVFLSTKVFLVGNSYLILKEGEGSELHFLILTFGQSYLLQCSVLLLGGKRCVAGCSNKGTHRVIPWLVIWWRACLFSG